MWAKYDSGTNDIQKIITRPQSVTDNNGVQHPSTVFAAWTADQLRAIGIYPVQKAANHSKYERVTGVSYSYNSGTNTVDEIITTEYLNIVSIQDSKKAEINKIRDAKLRAGYEHNGNIFETDEKSIANLTATVAAVAGGYVLPVGFAWRTRDNVNVAMDAAALQALADAIMNQMNAIYVQSWTLKATIDAFIAGQESECATTDVEAGWPAVPAPVV